ncbi:MAG: 30S ribosomal protein S6 [Chloroflexota bacterium]|nr:30S ribosomal protein S6 [Chloroflexota bacterium]MDE2895475.1 30S ribosomal protein S6 [Chloroflexota bacterium]
MAQGETEYEIMVVLHPDVAGEQVEERMAHLRGTLTQHGNDVTEVIDWGRRRLAYPIKQSYEGHYLLAHYEGGEDARRDELEQSLLIDEQVLRHLIVRRDH